MKKAPTFEDFAFQSEINEAVIDAAVAAREVFYAETGASSDTFTQELPVYLTVPEGVDRAATPFVRLPAWSDDNGRKEGAVVDALIASITGRPVLAPNAPGIDFSEWQRAAIDGVSHLMTPDQREDVRQHYSLRKVGGAVMMATVAASKEFGLSGDFNLLGSSLAVGIAAGALNKAGEEGIEVPGVSLSEGVNFIDRSMGRLMLQFIAQNRFAGGYLEQNPDIIPDEAPIHWLKRTIEGWPANGSYVRALARASFLADLGDISWMQDQNTRLFMTRGTASALADEAGYQKITQELWQAGANLEFKEYPGHDHPYTMTIQSMINDAKEIA